MGRVLSYSITKDKGSFTKKELTAIYETSKFYNSKELLADINSAYKTKLKELWSCENFWLGIGSFYPNWGNPTLKDLGSDKAWDLVKETIDKYEKELGFIDAVFKAKKEGLINFHDGNTNNSFRGFCKVQGNELNSLFVFKAVVEISKKVPSATLHISDEGEFLLCPLKIKNGKVLPEVDDLIESMEYYALKMLFSKTFEGNILNKLEHKDFGKLFKDDIGLENTYGDMTKHINDKLRNLKAIEKALLEATKNERDNALYFYNINNRQPKDWFKPELFVRPVNVEKFLDYKMSPSTMMDGFSGTGFGLSNEDTEAESLKSIARMFSMLGGKGFDKGNIKVLGAKE